MIQRTRERFTIQATIGDGWYAVQSSLHLLFTRARSKKRGSRTPRRVGLGITWRRPVRHRPSTTWDSPTASSILEDMEFLHEKLRTETKRMHLPLHERDPGAYHEKHLLYVLLGGEGDPPGLTAPCPICDWAPYLEPPI